MLDAVTRPRLILIWFAAVALVVVTGVSLGAAVTLGTGITLAALSLVPPAVIYMLWPSAQTPTVAEVLHDAERN